ncbi:putative heme-binding domain-containing protein [Neorhodopirellula lusitana]|uniref:Heme-binding domain-containing protein n=1 Tax=Neorhodopirellula lusitana TaxID=445327 RepID=A0ABY1QTE0_9BACT|nr:family 16 glycoside hydrolase [Neorhodopirellula lusitana]SMP78285.1 putative heme-binding domain-containing protein [Neorhodopirellula lusitana]
MTTKNAMMRLIFGLMVIATTAMSADSAELEFQNLFNGKDLSGWAGTPGLWSVEEGVIVGRTTKENPIKANTFLVWQGGEVGDFIFKTKVRFEGNNTGVQYRSELIDPDSYAVKGYQADLHKSPDFFGMLYAEKWRGIVARRFQRVEVSADGKPKVVGQVGDKSQKLVDSQWNELTIIAVGNRQIHQVNGITTMDLTDNHPEAKRKGILALQLHRGPVMKVEFKDIRLKELSGQDATTTLENAVASVPNRMGSAKPKPDVGKVGAKPTTDQSGGIQVADGFKVERIYEVPKAEQGSWVSLTTDGDGGFYASDQGDAGLFHFEVSDDSEEPTVDVRKVPIDVSGAQGMVWHDGALYFNRGGSPLYKLTDSTGDGLLDHSEELSRSSGRGEHGNHAVIAAEDGQHLYVDAGNHTNLPDQTMISRSRVPTWDEDLLLRREWDANGHARGRLAPGGWITQFDPKTKKHEVYSIGYRNQFDISLNRSGDLFTFDADMEWDLGSPWYRPTRIIHAVSGSDYGWRSGSGKWPEYYEDSLPAVLNIGPGSPTGVVSGQGAKFPAKYQDAIFALDWTFGMIYAVHLTPDGAGYRGQQEVFCHGSPLPVTDAIVGHDGALYFTTGGRGTDSAVYRITYVGNDSTEPVTTELAGQDARRLRRSLEAFHGRQNTAAVQTAWPHLSSSDRWLRHAARIAIESQPVDQWADRVFAETNSQARITGAVALARSGNNSHQAAQLTALLSLDPGKLEDSKLLGLLRAYALTFIRLGAPSDQQRDQVIAELNPHLPHANKDVNTELVRLLVYLNDPTVIDKAIEMMAHAEATPPSWAANIDFTSNARYGRRIQKTLANQPPSHEINYAFMLRNLREGWTMDQLRRYIEFINKASQFSGGNSYAKFLANLRDEVLGYLSNDERAQLADISGEDFNPIPDFEITPPTGPGKVWNHAAASERVGAGQLRQASFENGRNLFHAAQCATCHRFDGLGGDVGPDLTTVKNKFDARYLLESIIEPSKVISDQYGTKVVLLSDGTLLTGLMVKKDEQVEIYPVAKAGKEVKPVVVDAEEIELVKDSPVSQMPPSMLDPLNGDEVRDLIAYLLSGGDKKAKVYGK